MLSELFQSCVTFLEPTSTVAIPASPSMRSANKTLSADRQASQLGDAGIPGVRLRASPPPADTTRPILPGFFHAHNCRLS